MYLSRVLWQLGALTLAFPEIWRSGAFASPTTADKVMALKPIDVTDFESAFDIQQRAAEDFSSLHLKTQEHLIYGRPGKQGQLLYANMTLYAPHGLQIVLMERFQGLIRAVDCKGDDASMSLTFKSTAAFHYASKTWDFINQSKEKKFLLITNKDGCGPSDERQSYLITNIREDAQAMTIHLTVQVSHLSKAIPHWDLDLGQVSMNASSRHSRRSKFHHLGDGVKGGLHDLGDGLKADFDKTIPKIFDVNMGTPEKQIKLSNQSDFQLSCDSCFIKGSFNLTGHISVRSFKVKELTLNVSPKDLAATLALGTTITDTKSPQKLPIDRELFSAPIPDAGFEISKLFKLGTTISYDIGGSVSFSGSASAQFGLIVKVPDTAQITADLHDYSHSSAIGFDGGDIHHTFNVTDVSAGVTLNAYSQPKLSFGVEVHKIANYDVDVTMKLPTFDAQLSGAYKKGGLCAPGKATTGAKLSSKIGVEVDLNIEARAGSHEDTSPPNYNKNLFNKSKPLYSHCFPLQIPGLGPKSPTH
ncbi:MAG: hypothetical protein Q9191_006409 [Dirinaria sp. TL-2023a]